MSIPLFVGSKSPTYSETVSRLQIHPIFSHIFLNQQLLTFNKKTSYVLYKQFLFVTVPKKKKNYHLSHIQDVTKNNTFAKTHNVAWNRAKTRRVAGRKGGGVVVC